MAGCTGDILMTKTIISLMGMAMFLVGVVLSFRDGTDGKDWASGFMAGVGIAAFVVANSAQVIF